MKRFNNKVVLITGGSGAIGSTTAKMFIEEGAKVVLVDINEKALKSTVDELGSDQVAYTVADVTKSDQVKAYVNFTVDKFGKIDIFFNNAGIEGVVKPIEAYPEEEFDKVFAVNVKGVWLGMKYVLPQMNDGGSIINTSSVAGLGGTAAMTGYVGSKHAVIGLTRCVALEAAPRDIRVNTIHPAPVDNRMMRSLEEGMAPGHGEEAKKGITAGIPIGRYATNEDIAKGVIFLASNDSSFITNSKLIVDGGMTGH